MSGKLFRDEVLAARQGDSLGHIHMSPPAAGWGLLSISLLVVVSIFLLLFMSHYTRHEQVSGTLIPERGLTNIPPPRNGNVARLFVIEGARVHAGDALVEISGEQDSTSGGDTQGTIIRGLTVKLAHLKSDLEGRHQLLQIQQQDMRSRLEILGAQLVQANEQAQLQRERANNAMALYTQWSEPANRDIVSRVQLLQQHDSALQNESQYKELLRQALQLKQQVAELHAEFEQLPYKGRENQNDIRRQLADVSQSLAEKELQRSLLIRAPVDGTVVNVMVHPGQTVTEQESMLSIMPTPDTLQAELWLPSSAIGFISAGDSVMMRYQAFPYQKFGQHLGHVVSVSPSAIVARQPTRLQGQNIEEPRYRVRVALDRQSVDAYGKEEPLLPGMAVDADVLLNRQRLVDWILDPLASFSGKVPAQASAGEGVDG